MTLKEKLSSKFVKIEEVANILQIGAMTKKNVFMYGRGGHAKSEIAEEFLKFMDPGYENCFIQACGEGLTEEKLFGGMDIKKFQKTGEIEYLVENSFMNYKYVVFEELLDSRLNVLLSLKDILTSGIFRQGKQQFKIKTEFILCLTNRTKQEVSEDNSIKALLERFPLEIKVEWDTYNSADYSQMFEKVLNNSFSNIAEVCQTINETGEFISPRTAIHMAEVYKATGDINNLKYFGASGEVLDKIREKQVTIDLARFIEKTRSDFNISREKIDSDDLESLKTAVRTFENFANELGRKSYPSAIYDNYIALLKDINFYIEEYKKIILNKIMENV